jgi:hypothetical protein
MQQGQSSHRCLIKTLPQIRHIAMEATRYTQVLKQLGERVEEYGRIHSDQALDLAVELCEQAIAFFARFGSSGLAIGDERINWPSLRNWLGTSGRARLSFWSVGSST